ncbi:MAG: hypothetical protein JWN04_4987 [Myxococcaceae bacterium]|nr:hypothetical protein [Myxococcaceae bacterium]
MSTNEILSGLEEILRTRLQIKLPASGLSAGSDLLSEIGLDSMQLIKLLVEIEEYFRVELDTSSLSSDVLRSVAELSRLIAAAQVSRSPDLRP